MEEQIVSSIDYHFGGLNDPRVERTKAHELLDILVIAICAIVCGADDWEAVAEYGRDHQEWFQKFLALPNGIPSHDTFWRVFGALNGEQFQSCFISWIQSVSRLTDAEVIAIDGKYVRGSRDKGIGRGAIDKIF